MAAPDAAGSGPQASPVRVMLGRAEGLIPSGNQFAPAAAPTLTSLSSAQLRQSQHQAGGVCPAGSCSRKELGRRNQLGGGSPVAGGVTGCPRRPSAPPGPLLPQGTQLGARTRSHWHDQAGADPMVEIGSCQGPPAPKAKLQLLPPERGPQRVGAETRRESHQAPAGHPGGIPHRGAGRGKQTTHPRLPTQAGQAGQRRRLP